MAKAVKKTTKKAASKKLPTKKAVVKKAASKKITRKKVAAKKVATKKNLEKKSVQKPKAASRKDTVTVTEKVVQTAKTRTALAKERSIFSFQRVDPVMVSICRLFGLLFVLFGGAFTIWHLQFEPVTSQYQTAMLSGDEMLCDASSPNFDATLCEDSTTDPGTAPQTVEIDPEPPVDFVLESITVGDGLEISVYVEYAEQVRIQLQHLDTNTIYDLGDADMVGENEWTLFVSDTTNLPLGEYRARATVANENGSYTATDSDGVVVEADQSSTESTQTESDVEQPPAAGSNNTPEPSAANVVFSMKDDQLLYGIVTITLRTTDFELISLTAEEVGGGESIRIDRVGPIPTNGEWRFAWDTRAVPNASYQLTARVFYDNESERVNGPVVQVENEEFIEEDEEIADATPEEVEADQSLDSEEEQTPAPEEEVEAEVLEEEVDASTDQNVEETENIVGAPSPTPSLRIPAGPLSLTTTFQITAARAEFVELYARPQNRLNFSFVGLARQNQGSWSIAVDTTQLPNGLYQFQAQANIDGVLRRSSIAERRITNESKQEIATSIEPGEVNDLETIVNAATEEVQIVKLKSDIEESLTDSTSQNETVETDRDFLDITSSLLADFKGDIDEEVMRYTTAVRSGDENQIARAKLRLDKLRDDMLSESIEAVEDETFLAEVDSQLEKKFADIETKVLVVEEIVKERSKDKIKQDTDGDGITDFDEIRIYNTDPTAADSDNDGFIDSAEILGGFDPKDPSPEAMVAYKSPKEEGIVREDILVVESIKTVTSKPEEATDGVEAQALIKGKALPNSFVTLYIFSTPIVVTVKTDEFGAWEYKFDKELEDGTHEVYVGVTDNTGEIVAKSNPFTFVKEAQAFTGIDSAATVSPVENPTTPSLNSNSNILVVLSIAVFAIGVVLILLGVYMDNRRLPQEVATEAKS